MSNFQHQKDTVLRYYEELDAATPEDVKGVLETHATPDLLWRGMHPFYEQSGPSAVSDVFWIPYKSAMTAIQRRQDIFMAGENEIDGTTWICSMGHLVGLFDKNWLGIPATRKVAFLPYAEFLKVEDGKIAEIAFHCDILSVIKQAGINVLPESTGAEIIIPGPLTHDGLMLDEQDPGAGAQTLALVNKMKDDLTSSGMGSPDEELRLTWHNNMWWFGPSGIGSTYTVDRYQEQHQTPFGDGLTDIDFRGHLCRFAEGKYACWFGWPNIKMKAAGGFLGMPASDTEVEMRVVDIYRRDGDKLAENWVFIDLLHFLHMQGLNVLDRMRTIQNT